MGLPNTYILLDQDQQDFVDSFDAAIEIDREEIKKSLKNLRNIVNGADFEIDFLSEHILGEE